jgi:hypothetical protein
MLVTHRLVDLDFPLDLTKHTMRPHVVKLEIPSTSSVKSVKASVSHKGRGYLSILVVDEVNPAVDVMQEMIWTLVPGVCPVPMSYRVKFLDYLHVADDAGSTLVTVYEGAFPISNPWP